MNYPNGLDPALFAALIAKSGGQVTPEQIQSAVDEYLTQNPVTAGELSLSGTTIRLEAEGGNS